MVFPAITQLDPAGPQELFARAPGARTSLCRKALDLLVGQLGLALRWARAFDTPPNAVVAAGTWSGE